MFRHIGSWVLCLPLFGCEPIVDDVFRSSTAQPDDDAQPALGPGSSDAGPVAPEPSAPLPAIELVSDAIVVDEAVGTASVRLELDAPAPDAVSAEVVPVGVEAQSDCFQPDFVAERTTVVWAAGERVADYPLAVVDDETAEVDETITLELVGVQGAELRGPTAFTVRIVDDDRTALIDAQGRFGVEPGSPDDQSGALQDALDAAASSGRGVVQLAPGQYVVTSVTLTPGTSLVGYGATLQRPPNAGSDVVTLRARHSGPDDSAMTLVQGVTLDGLRDQQGPFQDLEQQNAHLLSLGGDPLSPGRLRAEVQSATFLSGTADGIAVGPNSDITTCDVTAADVFREGLSVHGGNTRLRVRGFTASATLGTSGMWLDGDIVGFPASRVVDITMQDVRLETGDLEISIADGSNLDFSKLVMGSAPFRLSAPDSTVRISDSVVWLGIPTDRHNHWESPDDTQVTDSTIVLSESLDEEAAPAEMDRQWAGVRVVWPDPAKTSGRLSFTNCQFEIAGDVESTDSVSIAESLQPGGELLIQNSSKGDCACDWFAPTCLGCVLEP